MLVVLEVEVVEVKTFNDIQFGKEITLTGKGVSLYPEDNYIQELKEKAKKYDELIDLGETIAESMFSSVGEQEAKEKSIEILKDFSKLGFLGHNVEPISKVIENPNAFKYKYKSLEERFTHSLNQESSL